MKRTTLVCSSLLGLLLGAPASAGVVYKNDFEAGPAALDGFVLGNVGSAGNPIDVTVSGGQMRIDTDFAPSPTGTYASLDLTGSPGGYTTVLADNPGLVSWSFNVSNLNGTFNNAFGFTLASSHPDSRIFTSTSYTFMGGGFVGDRMALWRQVGPGLGGPSFDPIIDITDGLGVLPEVGSIRITYEPDGDLWSLYGEVGSTPSDPRRVSTLLGTAVDGVLTGEDLPWIGAFGLTTGVAFFDNVTVRVHLSEPAVAFLLLAGYLMVSSRHRARVRR